MVAAMLRTGTILVAAALAASGCSAEIGDECGTNVDCSPSGDRVCDTTAPGGYCTILDCGPDTCPEEAVCVAWGRDLSERTYCMRACGSGDDCRDGYVCFDPADFGYCMTRCSTDEGCRTRWGCTEDPADYDAADWGTIIDETPGGSKFCTRKADG